MGLVAAPSVRASAPTNEPELIDHLASPTPEVIETLASLDGDLVVLGAGGKIGPSLTGMAVRALRAAGSSAEVIGVSRWSDEPTRQTAQASGVRTISADLADPRAYPDLPDAGAVLFLAGQKFGTTGNESSTWWANAAIPAYAAARYAGVPTVVYSTGNVYPLRPLHSGGSQEADPVGPIGQYAQSCLAREQMFRYAAEQWQTPVCLYRLNYAVELRYGVIADLARTILAGEPVDVTMPAVNVVWQRDSNVWALRALGLCASPARALNATGPETISVRRLATMLATRLGAPVEFRGTESDDALLSDSTACHALFGYPTVSMGEAVEWVARWIEGGGRHLGRPTKFSQRDGAF